MIKIENGKAKISGTTTQICMDILCAVGAINEALITEQNVCDIVLEVGKEELMELINTLIKGMERTKNG